MCDLPFQWDDGVFISPFVATSESDTVELAEWIADHAIAASIKRQQQQQQHRNTAEGMSISLRLTDLGCGDGSALFFLARHLSLVWQERGAALLREVIPSSSSLAGAVVPLQITATGIDLDEALIDVAYSKLANGGSSLLSASNENTATAQFEFICEDIQKCDRDKYFPIVYSNSSSNDSHVVDAGHVLFLYLLPEALEQLKDAITEICKVRGCIVVSNRWPVPYLKQWKAAEVASLQVYHYTE